VLHSSRSHPFPRVSVPEYDRATLRPGIVHLGVGAFHRSHQAAYLDDLAVRGVSSDWGVVGIGLRTGSGREALLRQNCLYTLLERSPEKDRARVIGSLVDYLYAPEEWQRALATLAGDCTKLVTLTVTGEGYGPDTAVPRLLVEALRLRRKRGLGPFTVLSCDNLPQNGATTRDVVVAYARRGEDGGLASWIEANVSFPSSVVDRITPVTEPVHRRHLEREFGIRDRSPVVCEDFSQWIVENDFCNGRPPLEEVGVQFVADVTPYEVHKKRLLNGTHCAIGYLGGLAGHHRLDEALADPRLRGFAESMMEEVAPLLPTVLGLDLDDYRRTLLERFGNPRIRDRLQRLCARGSTKMPAYLLPSLQEAIADEVPHDHLTLAVAAWIRHLSGVDLGGGSIDVEDVRRDRLRPLALDAATDPRPLLEERDVFGSLAEDDEFIQRLTGTIRLLGTRGLGEAIEACSDRALAA
jgi:mannitol 2-dehydrogenase